MKNTSLFSAALLVAAIVTGCSSIMPQRQTAREWIDPDTDHRVVQLSTEPGSESLYFNLNPFTPDGRRMVITTPSGISMINLQTRAVEKIIEGHVNIIMVGHKTGQIYYVKNKIVDGVTNHVVYATDPATRATREILTLARGESVSAVNADETLLGGTITENTETNREYFAGGPNALHAAAVFYHGSSPLLALDDAMFAKYPLASAIITFAGTAKPGIEKDARANPGLTPLAELVTQHGASFLVCNNALSGIASWVAQQITPAGSKTTRDQVVAIHDEMAQHFLPGATLVPAGVAALNAAQEARFTLLPS